VAGLPKRPLHSASQGSITMRAKVVYWLSLFLKIVLKVRSYLSLLFLLIKISHVKKIVLFFIPELMGGQAEGNVFIYK
jgi:hypothetical protein